MKNLIDTARVKKFIEHKDPFSTDEVLKNFAYQLWETFQRYELEDSTFVTELTSGCRDRLLQRYTEMLFAWHFIQLGFSPTSKDEGPDLYVEHNGRRIWIGIITPQLTSPSGDGAEAQEVAKEIKDYLAPLPTEPRKIRCLDLAMLTKPILLRWTAALKEKREKLTGKIIKGVNQPGYIEKGIVKPEDIYVIAINSILLGHHGFVGISQYPNAIEATFAIGHIQIVINRETSKAISSEPSYRPYIINHNQSHVPADSFLNPDYKEVSALIATHAGLEFACPELPLVLVHNPYAVNPLPKRIFKAREEYIAEDKGDFWEIRNMTSN
ncbi:hypothetical protein [Phormidesmis sp. 146-33]